MLAWMIYVLVVTILLGGAALAAEHLALIRKMPTRWIWGMSIIASLVIPTVISSVSIQIPSLSSAIDYAGPARPVPLHQMTSDALAPSAWLVAATGDSSVSPGLDNILKSVWAGASVALVLAILLNGLRLHRGKRRWEHDTMAGVPVHVAEDMGPAIVGLLRPFIVVPRWLKSMNRQEQELVMAHEQSHLHANDAQLLAIAILLIVAMPWNLPLWWQLRRLRRAIEVDCDARVLAQGHDPARYAAALINIGERQSHPVVAVAAMAESKSFLEQRIRKMVLKRKKFATVSAVASACLGLALVARAAEVSPPNAQGSLAARQEVSLDTQVLDGYVGHYQLGESAVLTITRDGAQLSAQLTGQPALRIYPQSQSEFFYKAVDAQISFVSDAEGRPTSLVLHQNGANMHMLKIDAAKANLIASKTEAKFKRQIENPGSEAALRRLIEGTASGNPNYDEMSPALAEATRKQLPNLQPWLARLGPVKSVKFLGVSDQGADVFSVSHEKGATHWNIVLDLKGAIATARVTPGP